ncbi:MAG: ABC transporter permease subunit [Kiloniellaceae bacterium]|nr:ABC transporter permease subunit [Kiloniellaceae bacterium]
MQPKLSLWQRWGLPVLVHVLVVAIWHFWIVLGDVPGFVIATPWDTLTALGDDYDWAHNTMITAGEIFVGYFAAVIFGVVMAVLFSWSQNLNALLMPLIVSTNMIPKVALGPIIIVWFSYGFAPNAIIAFSICFLPILLTTTRGLSEVEPELLDLVRALRASRWQVFTKIQLPGSLPYIFSGMKVAVVLAVAGAIVGEFIASGEGLGYLMLQVQVTLDTAAMLMAVLLTTLIGVVLYGLVIGLERLVVVQDRRQGGT